MTNDEMFIDMYPTTKATFDRMRKSDERIEALSNAQMFIAAADDDKFCRVYMRIDKRAAPPGDDIEAGYYVGILPYAADQVDAEKFTKLTVIASRNIMRLTVNRLWTDLSTHVDDNKAA